jgi:glyoxylase-like metal-dependent hydrolase (beta-lactamase superfamily II)
MTDVPRGQDVTGTAQLAAWQARTVPPVEQLADGLWSVPVPIPNNPLRYTSSYVFSSGGGLVLLDTGWGVDSAWDALVAGLESIGAAPADIRGVLVSHMHFDHLGLAGRVRAASGAWIAMHPADIEIVAGLAERDPEVSAAGELALLRWLGASAAEAEAAVGPTRGYRGFASMAVPDRPLGDGELADVPGWRLRALHTPGHTPGHLCFVDEAARRLFAGDHILPRITPNISAQTVEPAEPLFEYLQSLAKVRDLDVDEIMPAHEWRFRGLAERVDGIAEHHEHRLAELLAAIASHPDATCWDLAGLLTWSRTWDQYHGRMQISAVTETAAHVVELVRRGLAVASDGPVPGYRVAPGMVG